MISDAAVHKLLRHRVLGGEAFYRVVDAAGQIVEVEVVSAPGLEPGTHVRLTQAAVGSMSVVPASSWPNGTQSAAADPLTAELRHQRVGE
jgi:hypothetical protein